MTDKSKKGTILRLFYEYVEEDVLELYRWSGVMRDLKAFVSHLKNGMLSKVEVTPVGSTHGNRKDVTVKVTSSCENTYVPPGAYVRIYHGTWFSFLRVIVNLDKYAEDNGWTITEKRMV